MLATGSLINGLFGLLIIANSAIGIIQELRAKQTLDNLAIVGQAKPTVRRPVRHRANCRPTRWCSTTSSRLGPGDQIVVDGELLEAATLEVDESLLTGEADPIAKDVGDPVMSGSFVVAGTGAYRATKVGREAYAARLAEEASKFTLVKSELRSGINKILQFITYLLWPAGLLTIYTQLFTTDVGWRESVLRMVGALVPMVPEGLVLMTSIAFAVGVVRLGRRQCLVQELPAIEGLARVDVVCADKTGTLTENGMRVCGGSSRSPRSAPIRSARCWPRWPPTTPGPTPACRPSPRPTRRPPGWTATAIGAVQVGDQVERRLLRRARQLGDRRPRRAAGPGLPGGRAGRADRREGSAGAAARVERRRRRRPDAPGRVTPVALVVLEQRVRPDARDTLEYFASQHVTVKVISGDNAVSVGAVAGSLGLHGETHGRPRAARPSPTRWPTPWPNTPPSAGCGRTRSAPWCTPCSPATTPSR